MHLLWIATKPPAPPVDGGRLASLLTLQALAEAGVEITLVAPVPPEASASEIARIEQELEPVCRPCLVRAAARAAGRAAVRSLLGGPPYSVARHAIPEVRAEVARRVAAERFDAVHAEQLQALPQAGPAVSAGLPVVLRAQNVESDLWRATARLHPWAGTWLRWEARKLARFEGAAVRRSSATVALTRQDAARLERLAGGAGRVAVVPPPFPGALPCADEALPGAPALVLLGSGGWLPNRDGARWFLDDVWPYVLARLPGAILHHFGPLPSSPGRASSEGIHLHPAPEDSRLAFAPGSILVVPLRIASGIRMKILEAWARGVPVIATPEAAEGLEAEAGRELLIAREAGDWAEAVERLRPEVGPGLHRAAEQAGARRIEEGRAALADRHDARRVAAALVRIYGAGRAASVLSARPVGITRPES